MGKIIEKDVKLSKVKFKELFLRLMSQKFSGYVVVTVKGKSGIEESMMVFDESKIIGGAYEYLSFGKLLLGDDAKDRMFNALAAKVGYMDIVALTKDKMQLVLAFNSKTTFEQPIDKKSLEKTLKTTFDNKFESEDLKNKEVTRDDVLHKYNLKAVK